MFFLLRLIIQNVAHAVLLGLQIEQVVLGGLHLDGDPLHDLQSVVGKLIDLVRVVGQQPQGPGPQIVEDLGPDEVFPQVSGEAQGQIGLQGCLLYTSDAADD